MERTTGAFGVSFIEKKIQPARRRVAVHLPLPKFVVARADPRRQPVKVGRREPFGRLFDFFYRCHSGTLADSWR